MKRDYKRNPPERHTFEEVPPCPSCGGPQRPVRTTWSGHGGINGGSTRWVCDHCEPTTMQARMETKGAS